MGPKIVCIVEGQGEVDALPVLIRKLAYASGHYDIEVPHPIRVPKSKVFRQADEVRPDELERAIRLAVLKLSPARRGAIVILYDADDSCPAVLGPRLHDVAAGIRRDIPLAAVLAKREYEAWFIADIESLVGPNAIPHPDPESISDAKGYLSRFMRPERSYSAVVDQPAFTERLNLDAAMRCPSFAKFRRDVSHLLDRLYAPGEGES